MVEILHDQDYIETLSNNLSQPDSLCSWDEFKLGYKALQYRSVPEFNGVLSTKHLPHVDFLDHQIQACEKVIHEMNGRAILADEVGLGKTLEAGLILKEYMIRGMAKKVLILTPASLVNQWVQELNEKFYIQAATPRKKMAAWSDWDITVTSIDMAKRENHKEEILSISYDMIIIDEAHKLKNHQTKNYQFVKQLKKTYCLLLTATPIQNNLSDLFNLVSILKPGYLGDLATFKKKYRKTSLDHSESHQHIHSLLSKLMIRNRRKDTGLDSSKRHVTNVRLTFTDEEMDMYENLAALKSNSPSFTWLTLAKELCSTREACFMSLQSMQNKQEDESPLLADLIEKLGTLPHHIKAKRVVEIMEKSEEKFIIFTEYRASQFYLQWYLQQHGITSVPFNGKFKKSKRDWMKQLFRTKAQVMVATEAGSEGINLQFCNNMINYDLPWNPMRLEQRIGRIHRFGQEKDVHIYNFAIENTIEDQILNLLYEKIEMFKTAVGDLDNILENIPGGNFDNQIQSIMSQSESQGEMDIKLKNLVSYVEHTVNERRELS